MFHLFCGRPHWHLKENILSPILAWFLWTQILRSYRRTKWAEKFIRTQANAESNDNWQLRQLVSTLAIAECWT